MVVSNAHFRTTRFVEAWFRRDLGGQTIIDNVDEIHLNSTREILENAKSVWSGIKTKLKRGLTGICRFYWQ